MPCAVCGGRAIKTETGSRCLNVACEGSKDNPAERKITCGCGSLMDYTGINQLGEPLYRCSDCGKSTKL